MKVFVRTLLLCTISIVFFQKLPAQLLSYTRSMNVIYGQAQNFSNQLEPLKMDVYLPKSPSTSNPLIVFIHGGAYSEGAKEELSGYCAYFAQRGFAAVTISYRLGWKTSTTANYCAGDKKSQQLAGYRALQDTRAAIRYLLEFQKTYKIDPKRIFVGGQSAGAVTALAAAYMGQTDCDVLIPEASSILGSINQSGNTYAHDFSIKGVINMWGAVLNPMVISAQESVPVISFHGTADYVVPYANGFFAGCSNFSSLYGSKTIHNLLTSRSVSSVLHTEVGGGHGVYDFNYQVSNAYCFAKAILENEHPSGTFENDLSTCSDVILPVRLTEFKATPQGEKIVLEWRTSSEQNNKEFVIERSANGKSFVPIGKVAGNINTNTMHAYTYTDHSAEEGVNHYRLRQIDLDGRYYYSEVKVVRFTAPLQSCWYTTGDKTEVLIRNGAAGTYVLTNSSGQIIHKGKWAGEKVIFEKLRRGVYLLGLQGTSRTTTMKILVP